MRGGVRWAMIAVAAIGLAILGQTEAVMGQATPEGEPEVADAPSTGSIVQFADGVDYVAEASYADDPAEEAEVDLDADAEAEYYDTSYYTERHIIAGVDATFLSVDMDGMLSGATLSDAFNGTNTLSGTGDLESNVVVAPRIWLGLQGEQWGIVARYWELTEPAGGAGPFGFAGLGNPFAAASATGAVDMYTVDLELTRRFYCNDNPMQFALGTRYAWVENQGMVAGSQGFGPLMLTAATLTRRQFGGAGITMALAGERPICSGARSDVNLFWNLRGSLQWGDMRNRSFTAVSYRDAGGGTQTAAGAETSSAEDLFIGEVQVGVEWKYALETMPADAFLRVAGEYQGWDGSGGAATSGAIAGGALGVATAGGLGSDMRMHLYGVSLGAGLTY